MTRLLFLFAVFLSFGCAPLVESNPRRRMLQNGVGMTPPMGWNSWQNFGCTINETLFQETADAMVSTGLAKLGYHYVNIDGCWAESTRDVKDNLVASYSSFPSGIKVLADYVHSKGLKLGILAETPCDSPTATPSSLGYEEQDANTFALWGIDYLRYCYCSGDLSDPSPRFSAMGSALNKTNRAIFYSVCERGQLEPMRMAPQIANSWMTTINCGWEWENILIRADSNQMSANDATHGAWNDPNVLAVGVGNMTNDESIAYFSLWSISKAPLILGCDIRELSSETMGIIANEEVIAVNQDPLGVQAKSVKRHNDTEVWAGPLSRNRTVVLLLNRGNELKNITAYWNDIGIPLDTFVEARDLWQKDTMEAKLLGNLTDTVKPHACKLYVLTPKLHMSIGKQINKSNVQLMVGMIVGISILVGGVSIGLFMWRKKRTGLKDEEDIMSEMSSNDDYESGAGPKRFFYSELVSATNDFTSEGKLGEGGFGGVYRGVLSDSNIEVAVKRISQTSKQGRKEFVSEVKIITKLRHRNLVQLLGWCHKKGELLLVYEYMPNASLDFHLFKGRSMIMWDLRYKIALGLASVLQYLHEEWVQAVVHRDIKTSNIMLDSDFNAKLGDFGLARFADHDFGVRTTMLAGTMGYMAPECMATGKAGKESDIYSFGVVLLEIACGRRVVEPSEELSLVAWVWELHGSGRILEAVDPKLGMNYDEPQLETLLIVGLWCCNLDQNLRPSIKKANSVLNFEAPLPNLPCKMLVPTHFMRPSRDLGFSYTSSSSASVARGNESQDLYSTDNTNFTYSSTSTKNSSTSTLLPPVPR